MVPMLIRLQVLFCALLTLAGCADTAPPDSGATVGDGTHAAATADPGRLKSGIICPIPGSCIANGIPVSKLSTDAGVDGGCLRINGAAGGAWEACPSGGGGGFDAGRDLRLCDGGQCVFGAAGGAFNFKDSGAINCAQGDPQCTLAFNQSPQTDTKAGFAGIVGQGAYGDASVNVEGGELILASGHGSSQPGGVGGPICLDPTGGVCSAAAQSGNLRSPNNMQFDVRNSAPGDTRWFYWASPVMIFGNDNDGISETVIEGYSLVELQDAYGDNITMTSDTMALEPAGGAGSFSVVNASTNYGNTANETMVQTIPLSVTTTDATPNASMAWAVPSNTAGAVTIPLSVKQPSTANAGSQTWTGYVVNNAGTCTTYATGGAFAGGVVALNSLAPGGISVALSGCNVVETVTGIAATTLHWTGPIQYTNAGP